MKKIKQWLTADENQTVLKVPAMRLLFLGIFFLILQIINRWVFHPIALIGQYSSNPFKMMEHMHTVPYVAFVLGRFVYDILWCLCVYAFITATAELYFAIRNRMKDK